MIYLERGLNSVSIQRLSENKLNHMEVDIDYTPMTKTSPLVDRFPKKKFLKKIFNLLRTVLRTVLEIENRKNLINCL